MNIKIDPNTFGDYDRKNYSSEDLEEGEILEIWDFLAPYLPKLTDKLGESITEGIGNIIDSYIPEVDADNNPKLYDLLETVIINEWAKSTRIARKMQEALEKAKEWCAADMEELQNDDSLQILDFEIAEARNNVISRTLEFVNPSTPE